MPIIQGGPPEWIWERKPDPLKWEVTETPDEEGRPGYELKLSCGLEILRVHRFSAEELGRLRDLLAAIA